MRLWDRLLERPACGHLVQLYERTDESPLIENVGLYVSDGLHGGEGVLAITTPEHRVLLIQELERLGTDTNRAMRDKQLLWLDAQETLSQCIMSGWPDWNRFEATVGAATRDVKPTDENAGFRAYGEMVDILWRDRQFEAALRVEHFWNKLLSRLSFSLYCAYAVAEADPKEDASALNDVLGAHTHIVRVDSLDRARTASSI